MNKLIGLKLEENKMKKFGMTLMVFSLTVSSLMTNSWASEGRSGAQFLRVGVGARAPGMGGAFSPVADDATAIYYNPAGLAQLEKREVDFSYNMYFRDTAAQFLGYAHPTEKGTFGLGVDMLSVRDIEKRSITGGDADAPDLGNFNTQDMAISLGYANKVGMGEGRLHYGAALKYISSDLNTASAKTAAIDMGLLYSFREATGLTMSIAMLNLGGKLKYNNIGDPLPLNFKPGIAWRHNLGRMGKITTALDADLLANDGIAYVQPGVEWNVVPMLALRAGYQFGRDVGAGSGFSAGTGFRFNMFSLDYAFVPYGDLGNTHRVSLGLKF